MVTVLRWPCHHSVGTKRTSRAERTPSINLLRGRRARVIACLYAPRTFALAIATLVLGLCGCSDDSSGPPSANDTATAAAASQALPACALFGTPLARPGAFAASVPLPPGLVIMEVTDLGNGT